jgi:hypothetical protein
LTQIIPPLRAIFNIPYINILISKAIFLNVRIFPRERPHNSHFLAQFVSIAAQQRNCASSLKLLINRELQQLDGETPPLTFTGEGEVGRLHQVAYYENPGILMIVQSVEDQAVSKLARGKKLPSLR